MVHPDYQYTPKLIPAMTSLIGNGLYDWCSARASFGGRAARRHADVALRLQPLADAVREPAPGAKLSEYHTGYRAFSREVLEHATARRKLGRLRLRQPDAGAGACFGFRIAEVSCPTRYFAEASSINFRRSVVYGLGVVRTSICYRLNRWRLIESPIFSRNGKRLIP